MVLLVCVRRAFSSIAGFAPDARATDRVLLLDLALINCSSETVYLSRAL